MNTEVKRFLTKAETARFLGITHRLLDDFVHSCGLSETYKEARSPSKIKAGLVYEMFFCEADLMAWKAKIAELRKRFRAEFKGARRAYIEHKIFEELECAHSCGEWPPSKSIHQDEWPDIIDG